MTSSSPRPATSSPLDGFTRSDFTALGKSRPVHSIGSGPAVIVIHEIPGITPLVAEFGRKIADRAMTAVLPELFGTAGKAPSAPYLAESLARACVSREFSILATNQTSPITRWLRELASHEHKHCGGPGVGTVGMCITGGFALAMMVDPVVVAPALSQPSLPIGLLGRQHKDIGISSDDLQVVKDRAAGGTCVMGMRFTGDKLVPAERFERLREELGDSFIGVEIDSSEGNPWGYKRQAHSVLTEDYSDELGSPTRKALDDLLDFFSDRLEVSN